MVPSEQLQMDYYSNISLIGDFRVPDSLKMVVHKVWLKYARGTNTKPIRKLAYNRIGFLNFKIFNVYQKQSMPPVLDLWCQEKYSPCI